MPGFDGTGPRGMGPMTGGGRGWCNPYYGWGSPPFMGAYPYGTPYGYTPPYGGSYPPYGAYPSSAPYPYGPYGFGRGFGRGRGRGFGRGFGFRGYSPPWPYVGLGRGGLRRGWAY